MDRKYQSYKEIHFDTAEEFWEAFSPTKNISIKKPHNLIFRGHGDASWKLTPSLLRNVNDLRLYSGTLNMLGDEMVATEVILLRQFIIQCDNAGIKIPNDSRELRKKIINFEGLDGCFIDPNLWPLEEALDLMAMAQHHGVPTRLLDWTTVAYTALYFAASSAIANYEKWQRDSMLAVWVLDREGLGLHRQIKVYSTSGSISCHLAAQSGLFTIHPHTAKRGRPFEILDLSTMVNDLPECILYKITLPVFESLVLLNLCSAAGFSASYIYPTADGAGKGVTDHCNVLKAKRKWNNEEVLLRSI